MVNAGGQWYPVLYQTGHSVRQLMEFNKTSRYVKQV